MLIVLALYSSVIILITCVCVVPTTLLSNIGPLGCKVKAFVARVFQKHAWLVKGEPELTVVARIQYYHINVLLLNKRSFNFIAFLVLHLLIN